MAQSARKIINTQFYEQLTADPSPVSLADMKLYLKVTGTADDAIIQLLLDSATEFGEKYTGRDFRIKTWRLLLDFFDCPMVLDRAQVDLVDTISYLKGDVLTPIDLSITYLKYFRQEAEILLLENESYPTDVDDRLQAIQIDFTTKAPECIELIENAIVRHVASVYSNRGDCGSGGGGGGGCGCDASTAKASGSTFMYDTIRISRL